MTLLNQIVLYLLQNPFTLQKAGVLLSVATLD